MITAKSNNKNHPIGFPSVDLSTASLVVSTSTIVCLPFNPWPSVSSEKSSTESISLFTPSSVKVPLTLPVRLSGKPAAAINANGPKRMPRQNQEKPPLFFSPARCPQKNAHASQANTVQSRANEPISAINAYISCHPSLLVTQGRF